MSLFKVRDFWTVDLDQLAEHYESLGPVTLGSEAPPTDASLKKDNADTNVESGNQNPADQNGDETGGAAVEAAAAAVAGGFVVSLGRFHSIGRHNVFVCANLNGFICVIQVPESKQTHATNSPEINNNEDANNYEEQIRLGGPDNIAHRQLLCASQLGLPIVDVKCGFFTSTLKQSIGVLSFDKLIVYQVKRRQVDLLTAGPIDQSHTHRLAGGLDESLFSHKLEEHHRIDLIDHELASNIIITTNGGNDHHTEASDGAPDEAAYRSSAQEPSAMRSSSSSSLRNRNKHLHGKQQAQLPQRDLMVVQYHNQFLFTLIDHKKVVGNFNLEEAEAEANMVTIQDNNSNNNDDNAHNSRQLPHLEQLGQFVGPMPMVFARNSRGLLFLALATSDNRLHCLQVSKLVALAKQSVMKRVAKDLLKHDGQSVIKEPPLSYDNQIITLDDASGGARISPTAKITIDLGSMAEWAVELAYSPIQMDFIQRSFHHPSVQHRAQTASTNETLASQLLVTSRYYLDLFTTSGDHLWSQRFENPLICLTPYTIFAPSPAAAVAAESSNGSSELGRPTHGQQADRLLSLVCTDCLSADKCNLLVVDEDRIAWSALLTMKPQQLWRTNTSKVSGAIVALDSNRGQLSMSYLGTNMDCQDSGRLELEAAAASAAGGSEGCQLDQLDQLDEFLATLDGDQVNPNDNPDGNRLCRLEVDVCLEATNQWPYVQVNSCIRIRPEANSSQVVQNIVATLEFDDLINYESSSPDVPLQTLSKSVIQVQLGCCWPDRREPISFAGRFSMQQPTTWDTQNQQVRDENLMPKTLGVKLYLRFNVLHSGSLLQEESFMLPLNMVARLAHIDYSTGQGQTLSDVLANLNMYKRPSKVGGLFDSLSDDDDTIRANNSEAPYYLCDIFANTAGDLIEIVDDIIESDLVCRGFNLESSGGNRANPPKSAQERRERDMATLENINLLAQSLDCRLKYRSLAHSSTSGRNVVARQSSEDHAPAVMISIALKVASGAHLFRGLPPEGQQTSVDPDQAGYAIVWLHLCDLSPSNNCAQLSQEFVKLHLREWKVFEYDDDVVSTTISSKQTPVLVSIECDHPMPILFLQAHLLERLSKRRTGSESCHDIQINALSESMHDAIEINCNEIVKLGNFIAISANLYDCLKSTLAIYDSELRNRFQCLKGELAREYCKFHISTMTSLSLSKRLIDLPDDMQQQFSSLSTLTKQYQLNLVRILGELERLKQVDYQYSKIPESSYIVPNQDSVRQPRDGPNLLSWPNFVRIID